MRPVRLLSLLTILLVALLFASAPAGNEPPAAADADGVAPATAAADTVSGDGNSVGTTMLSWVDTLHFYQVSRLILLYVGSDQEALSLLQRFSASPSRPVRAESFLTLDAG